MFFHNFRIGWKSLKRNRVLSLLIVSGIALGIALSTTFATIRHSFAQDPIPGKSRVLHYVRLDSWDPAKPYPVQNPAMSPVPTQITYRDMREIMKSAIPARQTGMYKSALYVFPDPKVARPYREIVRHCFSDFFPMFQTPFRYGSGWDRKADEGPEAVVVLSQATNDKLFGGANSVGKWVRISDREFRVVGVLDHWVPSVKFFDPTQLQAQLPEEIYLPFNLLVPMKIQSVGNSDGWGPSPSLPGLEGRLVSENCWIQMWVELPDAKTKKAYEDFLAAYVMDQKKHGRFPRPLNNHVTDVKGIMHEFQVVPPETNTLLIVSLLFLAVCALNLIGLLLGNFLARAGEVGVRRALGASRLDIFLQHIVECELIGLIGGAVGILLSAATLVFLNNYAKTVGIRADFFQLDVPMVTLAVVLSLLAGFLAGAYPAWRTCKLAPAVHLKLQ